MKLFKNFTKLLTLRDKYSKLQSSLSPIMTFGSLGYISYYVWRLSGLGLSESDVFTLLNSVDRVGVLMSGRIYNTLLDNHMKIVLTVQKWEIVLFWISMLWIIGMLIFYMRKLNNIEKVLYHTNEIGIENQTLILNVENNTEKVLDRVDKNAKM